MGTWPSISHSAEALGAMIPLTGLFWQNWTRSRSFYQKQALLQFSCKGSIREVPSSLHSHLAWDWMSQCFLNPHPRYQQGSVGSRAFCPVSAAAVCRVTQPSASSLPGVSRTSWRAEFIPPFRWNETELAGTLRSTGKCQEGWAGSWTSTHPPATRQCKCAAFLGGAVDRAQGKAEHA